MLAVGDNSAVSIFFLNGEHKNVTVSAVRNIGWNVQGVRCGRVAAIGKNPFLRKPPVRRLIHGNVITIVVLNNAAIIITIQRCRSRKVVFESTSCGECYASYFTVAVVEDAVSVVVR